MTSEIKQRIEQIRRGEVPEEYKKIHGDIVPLTWDQISLADCIVPYEEKTSVANQYTRNLKYENFKKITVRYPSDRREQTAIAKVLSTADREIDLLRQDIDQEKQKKKALMQLLLTGIVRVTPCH